MSERIRRAYPSTAIASADRHDLEMQDWHVKREQWTPEGFIVDYERGEDWQVYRTAIAILSASLVVFVVVWAILKYA